MNKSLRMCPSSATTETVWRRRVELSGLVVVAIYAVIFAGLYKTGWWILKENGKPLIEDFTPMWLAGKEALQGHAAEAYDFKAFAAVQKAFLGPSRFYYPWPYPPVFFLAAALVALFPYASAFFLWQAATLFGLLRAIYRILPERAAVVATLASPLLVFNAAIGQNGALTASLFGAALVLLERQPFVAGGLIGCLTYKPQFVLVLPLALLASGRWRALMGAAASAGLLALSSLLAFGPQVWRAFPAALSYRTTSAFLARMPSGKIQSLYVLLRHLGMAPLGALYVQIAVALAAAGLVAILWRSGASYRLKAAAAATASLLVSPYLFLYDMIVLLVAAAFLAADVGERGSSRGERLAALGLYGAQFLVVSFSNHPFGFLLDLALFAFIFWRARRQA